MLFYILLCIIAVGIAEGAPVNTPTPTELFEIVISATIVIRAFFIPTFYTTSYKYLHNVEEIYK